MYVLESHDAFAPFGGGTHAAGVTTPEVEITDSHIADGVVPETFDTDAEFLIIAPPTAGEHADDSDQGSKTFLEEVWPGEERVRAPGDADTEELHPPTDNSGGGDEPPSDWPPLSPEGGTSEPEDPVLERFFGACTERVSIRDQLRTNYTHICLPQPWQERPWTLACSSPWICHLYRL